MEKEKLKTVAIIMLVIIVIGIGGIYSYNKMTNRVYQQGVIDATLLINNQILNNLQQKGYVPFFYNSGNETYNIQLVPYQNENE